MEIKIAIPSLSDISLDSEFDAVWNMSSLEKLKFVLGETANGYESVAEKLDAMMGKGLMTRAQLCVYVDGEVVIDICGRCLEASSYDRDSLQILFR